MKITKHFQSTASTSQVGRSMEIAYIPEATSNANTSESEDESLLMWSIPRLPLPTQKMRRILPKTRKKNKDEFINHIYKTGEHSIRCDACFKYPHVVKIYTRRSKISSIASESGTRYRSEVADSHVKKQYHIESVKALRLASISASNLTTSGAMEISVQKGNEMLAKKIGRLMIHIFNDAKRLTLTPHSFPSHMIAEILLNNFGTQNLRLVQVSYNTLIPLLTETYWLAL